MPKKKGTQESVIQEVLVNVAEVQLAAFKAGISFWDAWVEQASRFTEVASKGLSTIKANPAAANTVLLKITDASRENLRAMEVLPMHAAKRFIEELEKFKKTGRRSKKRGTTPRVRRAARAKN